MLEGLSQLISHPIPSDVLGWGAFVVFLISVFIDVSKIKLDPWKRILRGISKVFNAELIDSQKDLQKQIDLVQTESKQWQKRSIRRRILEFADECRRGVQHSQQMYLNVFDDISEYDKLCEETSDPNHVVTESVEYIKEL